MATEKEQPLEYTREGLGEDTQRERRKMRKRQRVRDSQRQEEKV